MQFYASHGLYGIAGIGVSMALFAYIAYSLFNAGRKHHLTTTEEVFQHYCGHYVGTFFAWYAILFITSIYWIMLVGAGATLNAAFGLPEIVGRGLMALASLFTILMGLKRVVDIIGSVGPVLIFFTVGISVASLVNSPSNLLETAGQVENLDLLQASSSWLASAVIYVGFSLMGLASFLPAMGSQFASRRQVLAASILGPVLLMGAMMFVTLAVIDQSFQMVGAAMPTMVLAQALSPVITQLFAVVIILGIYTTASPLMWVVCARFSAEQSTSYKLTAVGLALTGVIGGGILPFAELVNFIYPTVGYAGFVMGVFMLIKDLRNRY